MPLCLLFLRAGITHLIRKTHNKHMNVARAQYLFLVLVSLLLGLTTVHAADAASPIGLWKGADGTFEMTERNLYGISQPGACRKSQESPTQSSSEDQRNRLRCGISIAHSFQSSLPASGWSISLRVSRIEIGATHVKLARARR
jgi:hypothetical protein